MKGIKMIFISYIKEKRGFIGVQVIFILIFAIVFTLYSLPLATVLYGGLLCGFVAFIVGAFDFYRYYENHKNLLDVKHNISATLSNLSIN